MAGIPRSQPKPSPKNFVPYSTEALRQDLQRVRTAWDDCQATRDRNAIYGYLIAVYGLVSWWAAEERAIDRGRRALPLQRLEVSELEEPFAAIIRCNADPADDKRTAGARIAAVTGRAQAMRRIEHKDQRNPGMSKDSKELDSGGSANVTPVSRAWANEERGGDR